MLLGDQLDFQASLISVRHLERQTPLLKVKDQSMSGAKKTPHLLLAQLPLEVVALIPPFLLPFPFSSANDDEPHTCLACPLRLSNAI